MKLLQSILCCVVCLLIFESRGTAQYVSTSEFYFNIDWTSADDDYESSGGGYVKLTLHGGSGTTHFLVRVVDNGNTTVSTINVGPFGEVDETFTVSKNGATIEVQVLLTTICIITVGPPNSDDAYCVGASDATGVWVYCSSSRIAQIPDHEDHRIHHHLSTAGFDTTIKMIPKADGHRFYKITFVTTDTFFGNHLLIDEQVVLGPDWVTIYDYWVDAPE